MARQPSKFVTVYFTQGNYGTGWDDLGAHDSRKDARAERKTYDENVSYPHRVIARRVPRDKYVAGEY